MNVQAIWALLLQGKKVELEFKTRADASAFRIKLFRHKSREEKSLIDLGFLSASDIKQLTGKVSEVKTEDLFNAEGVKIVILFQLIEVPKVKEYKVRIIE